MAPSHVILGWEHPDVKLWFATTYEILSLALILKCVVEVEARPLNEIHSSLRLTRHIKRIVHHSRGLEGSAFHVILGWERLAIRG